MAVICLYLHEIMAEKQCLISRNEFWIQRPIVDSFWFINAIINLAKVESSGLFQIPSKKKHYLLAIKSRISLFSVFFLIFWSTLQFVAFPKFFKSTHCNRLKVMILKTYLGKMEQACLNKRKTLLEIHKMSAYQICQKIIYICIQKYKLVYFWMILLAYFFRIQLKKIISQCSLTQYLVYTFFFQIKKKRSYSKSLQFVYLFVNLLTQKYNSLGQNFAG